MTKVVFSDIDTPDIPPGGVSDLFFEVKRATDRSDKDRDQWEDNLERAHKIRMRIKKPKTFPFKGSSNIRIPTAEKNIRKLKASIMNSIFGDRKPVTVKPSPGSTVEQAERIEKFMNHLIMDVIDIVPHAEIIADQTPEKGMYFAKPYWRREVINREEKVNLRDLSLQEIMLLFFLPRDQVVALVIQKFNIDMHDSIADSNIDEVNKVLDEIENGETEFMLTVQDVIYDFPDVATVEPERCYVPADTGIDVQTATSATHEFFLPLGQIKRNADYKGWDKEAVEHLKARSTINLEDKEIDFDRDEREGIDRMQNPSELVRVWETYGYFDIDGTGNKVKSVITSFPDFSLIARAVRINTLTGKYPLVKFYLEVTSDRFYSHRGIPIMIEDLIKEIDVQHNMKIDSQTIRNAPMFLYRAGAVNPHLVQTIPNQAIPVNGLQPLGDTVSVLNLHNPNTEFSYERESQILNLEIQETLGQIDFAIQSQVNRRQPRTFGEVELQGASSNNLVSLDISHFVKGFRELFEMILELWSQFGEDSYEFMYFGDNSTGESVKITREEAQNKYKIGVNVNISSGGESEKIQKAQQILLAAKDPMLLQMGIIGPQQVANAVRRFYEALDIQDIDDLIITKPQPAPPPDPKTQISDGVFKEMTQGEQAQVVASMGVNPDLGGRKARQLTEIMNKTADAASKVGD